MIQEISTLSEFQEIGQSWDDLYRRSLTNNPFLAHTWLTLWAEHFGNGQTFALLHTPAGCSKPEAGVVLKRYNDVISFVENDFSACPDFLVANHSTRSIQSLLAYLKGNYFPSKLVFADTNIESAVCRNVKSLLKREWVAIFKHHAPMRSLLFSGTFDTYLKSQKPKFRSEIRRKVNRAEKNYRVDFRVLSRSDERAEVFDVIRTIEQDTWKAHSGSAIICHENQSRFYHAVFESYAGQNKARVYVLYFDDQPVSFVFGIQSDHTYYALKTSYRLFYREHSPGLVLFAKLIESLFKTEGVNRLEFLGSDARWKQEFSNHQEISCTLELYPMSLRALSYNMLYLYIRPLARKLKIIPLVRKLQKRAVNP